MKKILYFDIHFSSIQIIILPDIRRYFSWKPIDVYIFKAVYYRLKADYCSAVNLEECSTDAPNQFIWQHTNWIHSPGGFSSQAGFIVARSFNRETSENTTRMECNNACSRPSNV